MKRKNEPRVSTVWKIAGMVYVLKKRDGKYTIVNPGGYYDGEADYVPYFWVRYTYGEGIEKSYGEVSFVVTAFHKELFPSLRRRKVVKLRWMREVKTRKL